MFKIGLGAVVSIVGDDETIWRNRCEIARQEDPDFIEVWIEHWRGNGWLLEQKAGTLKEMFAGIDVILHAPFLCTSLVAPDLHMRAITMDEMDATIRLGEILEADVITVHGGYFYAEHLRREVRASDILAENLGQLVKKARVAGTRIAIENLPAEEETLAVCCYPRTTQDLVDVVGAVDGVLATLDIGHALQNNEAPLRALDRVLPILANIHLHDMTSDGIAHRGLGEGVLDVRRCVELLCEKDYTGHLTLEVSDSSETKAHVVESFRILRALVERRAMDQ